MILLFIGKQGSGKGTEAKAVSTKLNLCHISTGDLLRQATGELKQEIDSYILKGNLVPDQLILELLKERIKQEDCKNGVILDGFPRNLKQAEAFDEILRVDQVIEIYISDEEAIKRIINRICCKNCNAIYNKVTRPIPKVEGKCDTCQGELTQRSDDANEETVKNRLNIFNQQTIPILDHYKDIVSTVDGDGTIEEVADRIMKVIE